MTNINELLERLDCFGYGTTNPVVCKEAAEVIREQQAKIEKWKSLAKQINTDWIPANQMLSEKLALAVSALEKVSAIENRYNGGDWDEIEEARGICDEALAKLKEKVRWSHKFNRQLKSSPSFKTSTESQSLNTKLLRSSMSNYEKKYHN